MKIYIAGPIRNMPGHNAAAFDEAQATLESMGHTVINPIQMDRDHDGFDPEKDQPEDMKHYMRRDLPAVLDCDAVAVLPGWLESRGARLEVHAAIVCDMPIFEYEPGTGLVKKISPFVNVSEEWKVFRSPKPTVEPSRPSTPWEYFPPVKPWKRVDSPPWSPAPIWCSLQGAW